MDTLPSLSQYANGRSTIARIKAAAESKVGGPLIVVAVLALVAFLSGIVGLPARVEGHDKRIGAVESKVDVLERNEIRRDERQQQILDIVKELKDDVKAMRRR